MERGSQEREECLSEEEARVCMFKPSSVSTEFLSKNVLLMGKARCVGPGLQLGEHGKAPGVCGEEKSSLIFLILQILIIIPCWCMGFV